MTENRKTSRLLTTAAALAAAGLAVTPAYAQSIPSTAAPVKVGIIDSPVEKVLGSSKNVTINRQSFLSPGKKPGRADTAIHETHGTVVASSFIGQAKQIDPNRAIEVYSAYAFYKLPEPPRVGSEDELPPERIALDYGAASKALDWFKEKGVRVVVTAFVTGDNPEMRSFMKHAKELGLVVFAATNNDPLKFAPFPARDPYAIAVTGNNQNLDFRWNRTMDSFVKFQADGSIPRGYSRGEVENGSSFAVARVAAYASYVVAGRPGVSREEIIDTMLEGTTPQKKSGIVDLSDWKAESKFLTALHRREELSQTALLGQQNQQVASASR